MGIHRKDTSDHWKTQSPEVTSDHDRALLDRLASMANGYDPVLRRYLTPEQTFAATAHYAALKDKIGSTYAQVSTASAQAQTAQASLEAARANAVAAQAQASVVVAQSEAARVQAEAAMVTAESTRLQIESRERLEAGRLLLESRLAENQLYIEEQKITLRKAEIWVAGIEALAKAPPEIAERLFGHVMDVGRQLTNSGVPAAGQLEDRKRDGDSS